MFFDRSTVRIAGAAVLLLLPAIAAAQVQVSLNQPAEALEAGAEFLFQAQVTGAGDGCHWVVAEAGRRLEAWEGVTLVEQADGVRLRVEGGAELRTLQIRASARRDPAAFAVVTFQVRPRAAGAGPLAESKQAGATFPAQAPILPAWNTPFTRAGKARRRLNGIAWDPSSAAPSIVALENLGNRARVIRIGLDGGETVISREAPEVPPLDEQSASLAVLPGGDIVVADTRNHRICRLAPDGALSVLAGTGAIDFNGDHDAEGRPRPATEATLGWPGGLAVTAAGQVVFADWHHQRIRRFLPGGSIETLAGDGATDLRLGNDLGRRHPATACSLCFPRDLAMAPDGRMVFTMGGPLGAFYGIFILHPDGTLGQSRQKGGAALITVTEDNAIVSWDGGLGLYRQSGTAEPAVLCEIHLPLQGLAPVPGGGVLVLGLDRSAVCLIDPPQAGPGLAELAYAAMAAFREGNLERVAAIRASLVRWAESWPPSAEVVRDHLTGTRGGFGLPLPIELQTEPFEWLRGNYQAAGIRARIALRELDQTLEGLEAGMVERLKAMAP